MNADPKRMKKACRIYDALLHYYPLSFQQEYGATLAQQFRDEYRDVLASEKRFTLFRFWIFISFDFMSSLLRESKEEVVKMVKKFFFVYCSVAAGVLTLALFNSLTILLADRLKDGWLIGWVLMPSIQIIGALTLLGVVRVNLNKPVFWILSGVLMLVAVFVFLLYLAGGLNTMWLANLLIPILDKLFGDEDTGFGISIISYFYMMVVLGIGVLFQRKWLLAVCILAIPLPVLLGYYFLEIIPEWLLTNAAGIVPAAAWFTIAWIMKKEISETAPLEQSEAV